MLPLLRGGFKSNFLNETEHPSSFCDDFVNVFLNYIDVRLFLETLKSPPVVGKSPFLGIK